MEGLSDLKVILEPNDFMITIDLSDAYMILPMEEESRDDLCYHFKIKFFNFLSSKGITKTLETSSGTFEISIGCMIVVYLVLAASTRELCIYQGQILIKTLENLDFVINLEKSNLVPSQVILVLRFIVGFKENVCFTS